MRLVLVPHTGSQTLLIFAKIIFSYIGKVIQEQLEKIQTTQEKKQIVLFLYSISTLYPETQASVFHCGQFASGHVVTRSEHFRKKLAESRTASTQSERIAELNVLDRTWEFTRACLNHLVFSSTITSFPHISTFNQQSCFFF